MYRREREELAKAIVTYHIHCAHSLPKNTVNHFESQGIPRRSVYNIIKKYTTHLTTQFLPKSGRPSKISDKQLKALVKAVDNKTGVSLRRLGRRFGVHYSTISRVLRSRTSVRVLKRKSAPRYSNADQENRARTNSLKVYRLLKPNVDLIMDDEKYFTLTGDVVSNRCYYTSDRSTAPPDVKFKRRMKFEPKLLVWWAISASGKSSVYVHRSKNAVDANTYLHECIKKRLIPFIDTYHNSDLVLFWPDLASSHYSQQVQSFLANHGIKCVKRAQNPPNVPQARPIETVWSLLKQKVYEGGWEAKIWSN
jgi:transposase